MDGESQPRDNRTSARRVIVMVAAGIVAALGVGLAGQWLIAPIVGWAVACAVYVVWAWIVIGRSDGERTRALALKEDPAKTTSITLLLLASIAGLVALAAVLTQAKTAPGIDKGILATVGILSVVLSWFLVHTIYTFRYAVLYYSDDQDDSVDFKQTESPRYLDFAYLAFTIGMTFQVSDTNIQSTIIRATALRHALLSYLFGAVILASAVNLVAGLAT